MTFLTLSLFLASCWSSVEAHSLRESENPIRRIVNIMQDMQKEIEAEGEKEEEAFNKFMCYCDGNTDGMKASADEGTQRASELSSKVEALKAEKTQLDQELAEHQSSREAAKQDAKKAASIRKKENGAYGAAAADMSHNIQAMKGAIAALEKGMGAFVQMDSSQKDSLERVVSVSSQLDDFQRDTVLDLLQGKQTMQSSGEITGMLKAMLEEMEGDLKSETENEESAAKSFSDLSAAKNAEIAAATSAIESKTKRAGEVAVEIVQTQDDLEDTEADVAETQKFLADLGKQCAAKKAAWGERQTMRAQEMDAISQAVKILNDDDALDLFKKTAPSFAQQGMDFLQKSSKSSVALRAKAIMVSLAQTSRSHQTQMSLITSALKSKAVDFSKITEMIDGMVDVLTKEQGDDDQQKTFCDDEFEKSADEKKDTEEKLASLAASIEEMTATVSTLSNEIDTLQVEIKALDKAVAEATEQRKSEHAAFVQAQAENQAATQLVEAAKNKLNKFYRPNLYKAPQRRELTEEERIAVSAGAPDPRDAEEAAVAGQGIAGTGITVFAQIRQASNAVPPPPPETFGAYQKKDGKSNGVMALMDNMVNDLKSEHKESEHEEEVAQKDYEDLMAASQQSRSQNAKSITEKESAKSEWAEKIENAKTDHASTTDALAKLAEYIAGLHASCDFLVENYGARKEARTNEIEGLKNAKAVLSGANFA
jgi:chromosome segregation ATPase